MMKWTAKKRADQRGFTFVEIAIIAPIVILVIGAFITVVVSMTGEVLSSRASTQELYNVQDALNQIDQDVKLSSTFLAQTNISLQSPQGYADDTTVFNNVDSVKGPMLILNTYATTGNPLSSASSIAYLSNSPNACGSLQGQNTPLSFNIVYFIKNNSLWRRTIATQNYWSIACNATGTGTAAPWQQPSCTTSSTTNRYCETQDEDLVDGVSTSGFTIQYYNGSSASTPENTVASANPSCNTTSCVSTRNAALASANTVNVSIDDLQTVAGKTVEQVASLRSTRLDATASAIAPAVTQTAPSTPVVTGTYTQPVTATFTWQGVTGGGTTTYTIDYSLNGGTSWTNGLTATSLHTYTIPNTYNGEAIMVRVRVSATNSLGTSSYGTTSLTIPVWVPMVLQNGWVNYGQTYTTAAYTQTASGMIALKGLVDSPTTAVSGTVIATLPAGYRPSATLLFENSSGGSAGRVDIYTNGNIVIQNGSNAWFSFDGLTFMPNGTTFTAPTLLNGWTNYGSGYAPAGYATDSYGRVHMQGLVGGGTVTNNTPIFSIPSSIAPPGYEHIAEFSNTLPTAIGISTSSGPGTANTVQAKGGSNSWSATQAFYYPASYSGYTSLTLLNGWAQYPGYSAARYTKSPDGMVLVNGLVAGGATTAYSSDIAILPSGYRPAQRVLETIAIYSSSTGLPTYGRIDVLPDGEIQVINVSATWTSLDSITFMADGS